MSLISPSLAQRIEQARQAQLRAEESGGQQRLAPSKSDRKGPLRPLARRGNRRTGSENWLLSYLDLITLLLAMLVVLLALARLHGGVFGKSDQPVELVGTLAATSLPAYDGEYAEFDAVISPRAGPNPKRPPSRPSPPRRRSPPRKAKSWPRPRRRCARLPRNLWAWATWANRWT